MASPRSPGRAQAARLKDDQAIAAGKRAAAEAAAELVAPGMRLGLGTGTTVAFLLVAIARRGADGLVCVATSPATESAARELGLEVRELDQVGELDLAIDGADQIEPSGWLIKGGGAAHTREKIVANAARRFVVIVSAEKMVERLSPPVPLELVRFGLGHTLRELHPARVREGVPLSPDGGVIADYFGPIGEPQSLAARLSATAGLVEHGLFAPELISEILIGEGETVQRRAGARIDPLAANREGPSPGEASEAELPR
jgi:ribose 5-phosphate isomerase A